MPRRKTELPETHMDRLLREHGQLMEKLGSDKAIALAQKKEMHDLEASNNRARNRRHQVYGQILRAVDLGDLDSYGDNRFLHPHHRQISSSNQESVCISIDNAVRRYNENKLRDTTRAQQIKELRALLLCCHEALDRFRSLSQASILELEEREFDYFPEDDLYHWNFDLVTCIEEIEMKARGRPAKAKRQVELIEEIGHVFDLACSIEFQGFDYMEIAKNGQRDLPKVYARKRAKFVSLVLERAQKKKSDSSNNDRLDFFVLPSEAYPKRADLLAILGVYWYPVR